MLVPTRHLIDHQSSIEHCFLFLAPPTTTTAAPTAPPTDPPTEPASTTDGGDHSCPGGSLADCINLCPDDPADLYQDCVNECISLCS